MCFVCFLSSDVGIVLSSEKACSCPAGPDARLQDPTDQYRHLQTSQCGQSPNGEMQSRSDRFQDEAAARSGHRQ